MRRVFIGLSAADLVGIVALGRSQLKADAT
jgi:hypothetical protein